MFLHLKGSLQNIRDFYLASDGFRLTWSYNHSGQLLPLGIITLNRVADLRRVGGLRYNFDTEHPTLLDIESVDSVTNPVKEEKRASSGNQSTGSSSADKGGTQTAMPEQPQFGLRWKIFELDGCEGAGKACLVFPPKSEGAQVDDTGNIHVELIPPEPQVWFLDRAFEWHFLAPNFPTYFRMMLVHLGLPQWQMRFTSMGPPPGSLQLMTLLAPHLLQDKDKEDEEHYPVQTIDPAVFKIRNRSRKSAEKSRGERIL